MSTKIFQIKLYSPTKSKAKRESKLYFQTVVLNNHRRKKLPTSLPERLQKEGQYQRYHSRTHCIYSACWQLVCHVSTLFHFLKVDKKSRFVWSDKTPSMSLDWRLNNAFLSLVSLIRTCHDAGACYCGHCLITFIYQQGKKLFDLPKDGRIDRYIGRWID